MRTTSQINNSNSLMYISRNFQQLSKITSQVAMQQQVLDVDDDPLSANIGIRMLNIIAKSEQYNRNIKTGMGTLGLVDGFLASAKKTAQDIRVLTTGAASDTATPSSRQANAAELNEMLRSLISTGNTHDGSRYIFGGTTTTTPPFTVVNGRYVHYSGNDEALNILVDNNTTMPINTTGSGMYGNMTTTISSKDMNPGVSLTTDHSTPLADLNGGQGVPKGKILVHYSAYPDGLEVDLAGCDTLEDVKDRIEQTTADASRNLDPTRNPWLNGDTLDWRDMQDRYVKVTLNPDGNGISLQERDRGEPLPEPTAAERKRGLNYSGNPGYRADGGGAGIAEQGAARPDGGYTVHDRLDYINHPGGTTHHQPLRVDDYALNKVAAGLGIKGMANMYDPAHPDEAQINAGFIHGRDLDPALSDSTLLADLDGYNDGVYNITNGGKPGAIVVKETSQDGGVFSDWNIAGASRGDNTGPKGELYARAVNDGKEIRIEIYSKPIGSALASDLVATGVYDAKRNGGTVSFSEANNSGLSGTVGVVLPENVKTGEVDLRIDFQDSLQASVHVPAFEEEQYPNGQSRDVLNIASGWNIKGLDKPPAAGYDENHPITTDLDGNVSVNYRYDGASNSMIVELSRPASGSTPAAVIATGSIALGEGNGPPDMARPVSGRVELVGAPGFEQVSGSVYLELPKGLNFSAGSAAGTGSGDPTQNTFRLAGEAPAGTIVLGGATRFAGDLALNPGDTMVLKADTVFRKGQTFLNDVVLPGGGHIKAGTPLPSDTVIPRGAEVRADAVLAGTVFAAGQQIAVAGPLPAGTMIPRGSYYAEPAGAGFPTDGMGMYVNRVNPATGLTERSPAEPALAGGHDVRATFATVEDLKRAIEQAGVYVETGISGDGRRLEFASSLAGAWLTVSEDTDSYEQMGDANQQLTGLNLNGTVKGVNSDPAGNTYTEVVYYPPDPLRPDEPVRLTSEDGKVTEIEPGYYVRVYSDPEQMAKRYENRDNTKMVAEGFVPAGKWNPAFDADAAAAAAAAGDPYDVPAFLPANDGQPGSSGLFTNGVMDNLILEERNDSGVWGTVNLDYHGGRADYGFVPDGDGTKITYTPDDNAGITAYPGGLRPEGAHSVVMQEWDIAPVRPGVDCDYNGTFHGRVTADAASAAGVSIQLYKDSSNSVMTAKSDPAEAAAGGKVTLYSVDRHGNFALDADGRRIVAGSVALPNGADRLADGTSEAFEVRTGGLRNGGQEREDNIFSTINDIMDALNQNDSGALHDLIGGISADEELLNSARGDAGARNKRLMLLSERHADDVFNFTTTLTTRVGMDDQALSKAIMDYQASSNAYDAAMQVSAKVMQMSLLQYLQ